MKTNCMKTIGITVGICAALWLAPNVVDASEDGNSLNLDINLLNIKEDKAAIVDIQIDNLPIVGDLKVKIPSKAVEDSAVEEVNQNDSALATVELGGGDLVEDLTVSVLENKTSETATSNQEKSSLASVGLTTPLTEDVDVDVLSSEKANDSTSTSFDGGVVEVNASDLPILGETHVGVLDKHTKKDGESSAVSAGLAQVDLDGELLKDTAVKVLATERSSNAKGNKKTSALLSAKVDEESLGGLVEELDVSVLENKTSENATSNQEKSSLASVGLTTPLTEDVDVDVLSSEKENDSTSTSFDGGVVEVNASDLPILGKTHVGVLDKHTKKDGESTSVSSGLAQVNLDGELLKDTAVKVLATERSSNAKGNEKTSALLSAKVDEESLGGLVEELDVSVLENKTSETATTNREKSSLASVGLKTPLTKEVDVDVLLSESANDSTSSSFDGGLVEVNASDLPILGKTHVGVLDKHIRKDGKSSSVSTGLVQADLDGDLLEDTAIKVLAMNKTTGVDGTTVVTDGVSIQAGTPVVGPIKIEVLTKEQFYPNTAVVVPTPDTGGEDTTPTPDVPAPDNGQPIKPDTGDGNDPDTVKPGTDDGNEQGTVKPGTDDGNDQVIVKPGTGNENEQGTVNPVPDQGVDNPSTGDENSQDSDDTGNGQVPGTNDQNDETSSNDSFAGVAGGTTGEVNSTPDQGKEGSNLDAVIGFTNSTDAQSSDAFTGNMGAVLPKTGGPVDGTLLILLSLVLLASGLVVRKVAA